MALDEHDDLLERQTLDPEPVACRNERRRRRRRRWPMRIRRWRIDYVHRDERRRRRRGGTRPRPPADRLFGEPDLGSDLHQRQTGAAASEHVGVGAIA